MKVNYKLLHIFRNTPFGRETFLQSLYFCKMINAYPVVYIPKSDKFLFYFSNDSFIFVRTVLFFQCPFYFLHDSFIFLMPVLFFS